MQCETAEGVRSIKEITAVPGLTGVFIGSADLSMSLGHPQDLHHPEVDGAFHRVLTACKKQGILAGIATSSMQEAVLRIQEGFQIVTVMNDLVFFKQQSKRYFRGIAHECAGM